MIPYDLQGDPKNTPKVAKAPEPLEPKNLLYPSITLIKPIVGNQQKDWHLLRLLSSSGRLPDFGASASAARCLSLALCFQLKDLEWAAYGVEGFGVQGSEFGGFRLQRFTFCLL